MAPKLDLDDIRRVRPGVERFAIRTPVLADAQLSSTVGAEVHLKLDSLQPTGSFKIRGAAAKLSSLSIADLRNGVITASTGNHGRAVAHVANQLGVESTICLSELVPPAKIAALAELGCVLDIAGPSQDAAFERATAASLRRDGPTLVHSILDPVVLAGQGTCGLEIVEQVPAVTTVVVPVSGGGLISGIATAVLALVPTARLVGVSMTGGAVMYESLRAGHPVELPEVPTLADSLQGGIGLDNDTSFPIVRDLVDEIVLVDEDAIRAAMAHALAEHGVVLEGAGAVGIAALSAGRIPVGRDDTVVVVCSGRNAEPEVVASVAAELERDGVRGNICERHADREEHAR